MLSLSHIRELVYPKYQSDDSDFRSLLQYPVSSRGSVDKTLWRQYWCSLESNDGCYFKSICGKSRQLWCKIWINVWCNTEVFGDCIQDMEAIWSIQYGGKACVSINSIHVTYIFYIQPYIDLVLHQQFEFNFEAYFNNRVACMKLRVNSWYNPTSPEIYVSI